MVYGQNATTARDETRSLVIMTIRFDDEGPEGTISETGGRRAVGVEARKDGAMHEARPGGRPPINPSLNRMQRDRPILVVTIV